MAISVISIVFAVAVAFKAAEALRGRQPYRFTRWDGGERVLAIREQQTPDDPHIADAVINLGSVLADQGHLDLARASYDRGLAIYRKAYGASHPMVATGLSYRARVAASVDDRLADLDEALRITVATLGPEHPNAGVIHGNLGGAYASKKDWKRAESELEQALAIQTKTMGAAPSHERARARWARSGVVRER